jgi:hypothetical protein
LCAEAKARAQRELDELRRRLSEAQRAREAAEGRAQASSFIDVLRSEHKDLQVQSLPPPPTALSRDT